MLSFRASRTMLLALAFSTSTTSSENPQQDPATAIVSCVDWCGNALAKSTCVHSIHDVSAGAAGNPNHDDVFPPTTYDIVDAMNLARKDLGAPLNRAWWDGSVVLDWPANSSTPDRKTVWCPEPTAPNTTTNTTSWDLSAMDVKIINLQQVVPYPDTTILQANLEYCRPWVWSAGNDTAGDLIGVGKLLGEHYADVLDYYSKGGFTDEFGNFHKGYTNVTFGYLEIMNEIDGNSNIYGGRSSLDATRRYIQVYDGIASKVHERHPHIKFIGYCHAGRGDAVGWSTFLNQSEHQPGTPWPVDAVSFHLYSGGGNPTTPFKDWFPGLVSDAKGVVASGRETTALIKHLSPTTKVFVDEMGLLFAENVRASMSFDTMRDGGANTSFWNLQSAIYAFQSGELAASGVDMFGSSQLLGYPAGPPGTPVGIPFGDAKAGCPFQPQVTPDGNCPEMTMLDWETGLGNARWWTLKMLNDGLGHAAKGIMPSCSTSPDVYTRGFTGLNGTPLPGPTNRAVLLANMANDSRTSLIRDAVGGAAAPMWLVADKQGGFDAVPYVKSTVAGGLVTLPAYGVALVFIDDDAGCGNCSAIAPAPDPSGHNNTHTPVHPDPSSGSVVLQLLEPTDWLQFENGLGSTCTPDDPTACPQYNPQCDCTTPHCTMSCGTPGSPTARCCGRNGSSLWTGIPKLRTVATAVRPVQGGGSHTHIAGLSLSFRYISGSYPGAALGANFSVILVAAGSELVGEVVMADPPACKVDTPQKPPSPPPPLPPAVATLWASPHYDDYRFCESSPPTVKGPKGCPVYPGDIDDYSPAVTADVKLTTPVDNTKPLRVEFVVDNNDRDLLFDLSSLHLELTYA